MATLDTELHMLLVKKDFFEKNPSAGQLGVAPTDPIYIALKFSGDVAALAAAPFKLASTVGQIAYGETTLAGLEALSKHPQVEFIEKQRRNRIHLDGSVPDIKANQVWARSGDNFTGYTGRGVIVGIVDTGIDFRHQSLRNANGTTRVLKIWDQTLTAQSGETVPGAISNASIATTPTPLGYGVEFSSKQINFTLSVADPSGPFAPADELLVRHVDKEGHGTHVAGIAAGDGSQNGGCHGAYTYIGVAPEADIVMVRMWGLSTGDANQPGTPNPFKIDAIRYLMNIAQVAGKKLAINLSLGSFNERMDGSSADCQSVDTLLTNNSVGNAIVFSSGNDGDAAFHAGGTVPAGPAAILVLNFALAADDTKTRQLVIVYSGTNLQAQLTSPVAGAAGVIGWVSNGAAPGASTTANGAGPGSIAFVANTPNKIMINITPPTGIANMAGTWKLELRDSGSSATPFNAFCLFGSDDPKSPHFLDHVIAQSTLSSDASGKQCISVGCYKEGGQLSAFSGRGPTLDNPARVKPEICAPGEDIASAGLNTDRTGCQSCCCDCCQHFYVDKSGTSMSAPHITGVVALMLHKNPNLTHAQIRDLLKANFAPQPAGSTPDQNAGWGAGRVDAKKTVDAVTQVNAPVAMVAHQPLPLVALQRSLLETARGKTLQGLFETYSDEVWDLIQNNRKVATIWHRCKGPIWVRFALKAAHTPELPLQLEADGLHLIEAVRRFAQALKRFGSQSLRRDVEAWEDEIKLVHDGMSLRDMILTVGNRSPAAAVAMA